MLVSMPPLTSMQHADDSTRCCPTAQRGAGTAILKTVKAQSTECITVRALGTKR